MTQTHQHHRPPLLAKRETYVAVTDAAYTAKAGDRVIGVNRSGVVTITLPTAEVRPGRIYTVKDESGAAATNNITVDTEGSETIDGSSTHVMVTNYQSVSYYSDGTNWFIVPVAAAAAGSPGLVYEGSQTTEASTTSTSAVDLLTISSLTIAAGTPIDGRAILRRTTGASTQAYVGLKLNTTEVRTPVAWGPAANNPDQGLLNFTMLYGMTNYLFAWHIFVADPDQATYTDIGSGVNMPTAELTDIILRAKVGSGSITMYADEFHIWSRATS